MADTASKHIDMTTGSLWRNIPHLVIGDVIE